MEVQKKAASGQLDISKMQVDAKNSEYDHCGKIRTFIRVPARAGK